MTCIDPNYSARGDLWTGYRRAWETAEAEVVARYAGVQIDVVRSGRLAVTLDEVRRYMAAHGIPEPTSIPEKLPACTPEEAAFFVDAMLRAGLALVPARVGDKPPISEWWTERAPIGRDEAIAHLVAGGNLDYDAGQSGVVVIDCEDASSTASMKALGMVPDAITAKAQDPTTSKFCGSHFIVPIPDGVDRDTLETRTAIKLPGGGVVDILAGPADPKLRSTRVVVGLGSRLDVAPGYRYGHTADGVFTTGEFQNRGLADWLFSNEVECPESVVPLHGILLPRQKREYTPNPNADRITQEVDGMDVDAMLAGQNRVWITEYDSDGCYVLGSDTGSTNRSAVIHDGCSVGRGVHAWSGHLQEEWGRPHGSRLQFTALIHGESEADVAKRFDIDLSTPLTAVPAPEGFEYQEQDQVAAETPTADSTNTSEQQRSESAPAEASDDLDDGDSDAQVTVTAEELEQVRRLRSEIQVRERQRFDFGLAGVVHSSERDELYGKQPTQPILMHQDRLPWWTPTGLPPGYTPPEPDEDGNVVTVGGLPGYDEAPPIWVGVPEVVQKIIDAEGDRAALRAADWDRARREDEAGISGHNVLLQERMAFAIAMWDGEHNIAQEQWDAAELLLEMRQLVYDAAVIESRIAAGKTKTAEGVDRGIVNAGAKASEAATTARHLQSACDRIMDLVDAAAGVRGKAALRKKVEKANPRLFEDGAVRVAYLDASLSKVQRGFAATAVAQLRTQQVITGEESVTRRPALTVAPPIGTMPAPAA